MMRKMILKCMAMAALLVASLPSLTVAACNLPSANGSAIEAAKGWRLAGKYRSYQAACRKADQLEACGYDTCIQKQGGYYCVYCK